MKTTKPLPMILLFLMGCSALATNPTWHPGHVAPPAWSISPAHPGSTDVISFVGPFYDIITDTNPVYSNPCVARYNMQGDPKLFIDSDNKLILLYFDSPTPVSPICTKEYAPVSGVQGTFGPLAAGDWEFRGIHPRTRFAIQFSVGTTGGTGLYVDQDAPGPHNGTSWKHAYRHVQDALAAATSGSVIKVAEGIYYPDQGAGVIADDRKVSFSLKNDITLEGGYAGYGYLDPDLRDSHTYITVLSGDLQQDDLFGLLNLDDNAYHVVTAYNIVETAVLDGFVIRQGNADGMYPDIYGGGVYSQESAVLIVDCIVHDNKASHGGGIGCFGGQAQIINTDCSGNRAWVSGGGMYNLESHLTLTNCLITGNTSGYEATGGAAIFSINGDIVITNSTIADNPSPVAEAISGFGWGSPGLVIKIANSILYNGGNEIWNNQPTNTKVSYSNVQGGWLGIGNMNSNPLFVKHGQYSIEGEWIAGDYRVHNLSPIINQGRNSELPSDIADLDGDSNTIESLPLDLDFKKRIQGIQVDMGAYERSPIGGGVSSFTFMINGTAVHMTPDANATDPTTSYIGCAQIQVHLNFKARLSVRAVPTSLAGGNWSGSVEPSVVGPGIVTVNLCVKVNDLDITQLPSGLNQQVADVTIQAVPAL